MTERYINDIQLSDFNDAIKTWIRPDDWILTIMSPELPGIELPSESDLSELMASIGSIEIEPYSDVEVPKNLIPEKLAPTNIKEEKMSFRDVRKWTLENGVSVYYMPTTLKNDELQMFAMRQGGASNIATEDLLHSQISTSIVSNSGIGEWDANVLNKFESDKVMYTYAGFSNMVDLIQGSSSPRNLRAFFEKLHLSLAEPRMTSDGVQASVAQRKTWLQNEMENPENYFYYYVNKVYTKDHPRNKRYLAEDMDRIDAERSFQIYKDRLGCASGFVYVFVGNADENELKDLVTRYLGNLPACDQIPEAVIHRIPTEKESLKHIIKKGSEDNATATMRLGGDFTYDDRTRKIYSIALSIANIKLRERIREDLGGVYGIYMRGGLDRHTDEFSWSLGYSTAPAKIEMLMEEVKGVLNNFMENGPTQEDLDKIKEQQIQAFKNDSQNNRFWSYNLANKLLYGESIEDISLEALEAFWTTVTAKEVHQIMKQTFAFEQAAQFFLFPEDTDEAKSIKP